MEINTSSPSSTVNALSFLWHKEGTISHLFFSVFTCYLMIASCCFDFMRVRMMQSCRTSLGDSVWTKPQWQMYLKAPSLLSSADWDAFWSWFETTGLMHRFLIVDHFTARDLFILEKSVLSPKAREVSAPYGLNHSNAFTLSERQEAHCELLWTFYFYSESQITMVWEGDFFEEGEGRKTKPHHPTILRAWALP